MSNVVKSTRLKSSITSHSSFVSFLYHIYTCTRLFEEFDFENKRTNYYSALLETTNTFKLFSCLCIKTFFLLSFFLQVRCCPPSVTSNRKELKIMWHKFSSYLCTHVTQGYMLKSLFHGKTP